MLRSVMSAVLLDIFFIHKLSVWVGKKFNCIRVKFPWQGPDLKYKYPLVRWSRICIGQSSGGWGILELNKMNKALLGKWCWHYSNPLYHNIQKSLVLAKHSLGVKGKSPF
jgi:hypothetical protein